MSKMRKIIGSQIGSLKVLSKVEGKQSYVCRCRCGTECTRSASYFYWKRYDPKKAACESCTEYIKLRDCVLDLHGEIIDCKRRLESLSETYRRNCKHLDSIRPEYMKGTKKLNASLDDSK